MEESGELKSINIDNIKYKTRLTKKYVDRQAYQPIIPGNIYSFIPGSILKIMVKEGDKVKKGDVLLQLEAMKMSNNLIAPIDGKVIKLHVKQGDMVHKNHLLVEIK